MKVEYDRAKRERTLEERGLDFEWSPELFSGDFIERADERHDYGEPRYIAVGMVHGMTCVVVWTPRGDAMRIISMRIAHDHERELYRRELDRS